MKTVYSPLEMTSGTVHVSVKRELSGSRTGCVSKHQISHPLRPPTRAHDTTSTSTSSVAAHDITRLSPAVTSSGMLRSVIVGAAWSTTHPTSAGSAEHTSSPRPPVPQSAPLPPARTSSPDPPTSRSAPGPPRRMSCPDRPMITSRPPRPQITSSPGVPRSTSGPWVPMIVHSAGLGAGGVKATAGAGAQARSAAAASPATPTASARLTLRGYGQSRKHAFLRRRAAWWIRCRRELHPT